MTKTTEPTDKEVAAAQAVLARKAEADAARVSAQLAPLKTLVEHEALGPLLDQAKALFGQFPVGTTYGNHLNAMVIGMENMQRDVSASVPAGISVESSPAAA